MNIFDNSIIQGALRSAQFNRNAPAYAKQNTYAVLKRRIDRVQMTGDEYQQVISAICRAMEI